MKKSPNQNPNPNPNSKPMSNIPLPPSIEELITSICREKSTLPPDHIARKRLSALGEAESLRILTEIRKWGTVKKFSAAIMSSSSKSSPLLSTCGGSAPSLTPSPCRTIRAFFSPSPVSSSSKGNSSTMSKRMKLEFPDDVVASIVEHFVGSPQKFEVREKMEMHKHMFDALDELEFRKAFLILNYIGSKKLESVVSIETIRKLKGIKDMDSFEVEIWNEFGRENCKENERRKYLDWDSGKTYNYQCHVSSDGSCTFKGPFLSKTTTLLQKVIGDENVLIVKFVEDEDVDPSIAMSSPVFNKAIEEGILVGQKCYHFFVFKDGGKEEKKTPGSSPVKCYFVRLEAFSDFFNKGPQFFKKRSIQEARCIFMHIHTASSLSNYMSRLALILSKTITLGVNLDDVNVEVIDDVPCQDKYGNIVIDEDGKPLIHTDGTGFISEDLALMCPLNCFQGTLSDDFNNQGPNQRHSYPCEPPLLIQFRMFHHGRAIKGTVLLNKELPPKTIQVRPSMIKIHSDPNLKGAPSVNKFEIVTTSNKPKNPRLSKNLIALLHYGGVPREFFLDSLRDAVKDTHTFLTKKRGAVNIAQNRDIDENKTTLRMIASGIPLDEPFLLHRLSVMMNDECKSLKAGRLPVNDSFYLMGTADPTKTLNSGEVCVIVEQGQLSGRVLVYRNPGTHPGDIHVVNATYVKGIEKIVGNAKYGIFFPSKGPRSMGDEIAGGDYDGDMYWVSRNSEDQLGRK